MQFIHQNNPVPFCAIQSRSHVVIQSRYLLSDLNLEFHSVQFRISFRSISNFIHFLIQRTCNLFFSYGQSIHLSYSFFYLSFQRIGLCYFILESSWAPAHHWTSFLDILDWGPPFLLSPTVAQLGSHTNLTIYLIHRTGWTDIHLADWWTDDFYKIHTCALIIYQWKDLWNCDLLIWNTFVNVIAVSSFGSAAVIVNFISFQFNSAFLCCVW